MPRAKLEEHKGRHIFQTYLTEEDDAIIETLMEYYGVNSKNEIMRMGLRSLKREVEREIQRAHTRELAEAYFNETFHRFLKEQADKDNPQQ